ncbi:epithelial cell adhesion molecule-like isoform X2 [Alligator sinensis]|uniref:Epithelial cell adhesion molecule-like isoform X2 n=1 Tax=Alligator sinensis TaxID=38654 RepID=A0A3Q0H0K1_ALLSI|nr:epithelial cell adhesion molecule-like isoform X2 [Alligator sinensis]
MDCNDFAFQNIEICSAANSDALSQTGLSHPSRRLDVDSVYDPECEEDGTFKSMQCDEDSNLCWCVDSAGARVTDKTGEDPKCDHLVWVHLIQIDFSFKAAFIFLKGKEEALCRTLAAQLALRFAVRACVILNITVQEFTREISLKISRNSTKETVDIATVAYYTEQELKNKFSLSLDDRNLEIDKDSIRVLFFDNEPPCFNMKTIYFSWLCCHHHSTGYCNWDCSACE